MAVFASNQLSYYFNITTKCICHLIEESDYKMLLCVVLESMDESLILLFN